MWKNKEQPVVKTGKMCRIAQNYGPGRALPLHPARWLGIMCENNTLLPNRVKILIKYTTLGLSDQRLCRRLFYFLALSEISYKF